MIHQVKFVNPITNNEEILDIEIENYSENDWSSYTYDLKNNNLYDLLNKLLIEMTPKLYRDKIYFDTNSSYYKSLLGKYIKILYIIPILFFNKYLDKLIDNHIQNILYEDFTINNIINIIKTPKTKTKIPKAKVKNIWIKHETKDLFTNKITYIYDNLKTKESIESDNPDLLKELNNKKHKNKEIEKVNIADVQFNF